NYLPIKERLVAEGHVFKSETDTEVIAHLIERHLQDTPRLDEATRRALRELRGSYAIVVLSKSSPDRLVAAKHGAGSVGVGRGPHETFPAPGPPAPPVPATPGAGSGAVGPGQDEPFPASDIPAILAHTRDVVILEDDDIA